MWLKIGGQGIGSDRRKGCKEGTPESVLKSLASLCLRAGLFICRAKSPEVSQMADEPGLNVAYSNKTVRGEKKPWAYWSLGPP